MEIINTNNWLIKSLQFFNSQKRVLNFLNFTFIFYISFLTIPSVFRYFHCVQLTDLPLFPNSLAKIDSFVVTKDDFAPIHTYFLCFIFVLNIFQMLISFIVNFFTLRAINSTKSFVRKYTLKKQMNIYRLFSSQILLNILFFYCPLILSIIVRVMGTSPIYVLPFNTSIVAWYFPAQFLLQLVHLPKIRRVLGMDNKTTMSVNKVATIA